VNHDQYNALCKACDQLLLAPESGDERIAAPWLHVIRPHPIFLEGYADIFESQFGAGWKRRIRNIASALRHLTKSCFSRNHLHWLLDSPASVFIAITKH
jgi:hypothetical protein